MNNYLKHKLADYLLARNELEGGLFLNEDWKATLSQVYENLEAYQRRISNCQKCDLGKTRTNFVFGVGNAKADIVFIGEAPGREEDLQGEPFVGRAGKLLDEVLSNVGFRRDEVYICNVLKCRPPENRDPLPQEIALCEPYLWHQLELINPELIVALGRISAQSLLNSTTPIGKLREATFLYRGIPFIVTYHPAAILRNPSYRKILDEDIKKVRRFYDELKRKSYPDQSG